MRIWHWKSHWKVQPHWKTSKTTQNIFESSSDNKLYAIIRTAEGSMCVLIWSRDHATEEVVHCFDVNYKKGRAYMEIAKRDIIHIPPFYYDIENHTQN